MAIGVGVVSTNSSLVQGAGHYVPTEDDKVLMWKDASGPNGERDPVAAPLYQAVIEGDEDKVKALLIDRNAANRVLHPGRWSPLMVAVERNDQNIVKTLLDSGANINYVSEDHFPTPLDVALTFGVPRQDLSIFNELLDRGADINVGYANDNDIAIHAAYIGQMDLVDKLLKHGYRRDLPRLLDALEIRQVSEERQAAKMKAIEDVKKLL